MSLRAFLQEEERAGEVLHISDVLSTRFEISAVLKELEEGPILIFENVEGYDVKVVANVCNSREKLCKALRVDGRELYSKVSKASNYPSAPEVVAKGPVREVTEKPELSKLPILTHYERDAGAYITSAVIYAKMPKGEVENVSIHRLLVLDDDHLAIRLVPRHLFQIWKMAKEKKVNLEVSISLGLHPAVMLAAATSPPFGVNEFGIANALLERKLKLIKCSKVKAYAPAEAELVLEGILYTDKEVPEGPLVDLTGTYDITRNQPVIEVVSFMHRKDYFYQALLPGGAEHRLLMGFPREVAIWEAVSKVVPEVKAVNLTKGGSGWLHAVISIKKQKEGDSKNALMAAFAAHPSLKHAVVVDSDIDVYDMDDVEWTIATRFQADKDLILIPHARGSSLDPSADQRSGETVKWGIDATRPLDKPEENFERAKIPLDDRVKAILERIRSGSSRW